MTKEHSTKMARRENERTQQRNKNIVLAFSISLVVLLLTITFTVESEASGTRLIPMSIMALIAGVLLEGKRVSEKWSTLLWITLGSLLFSMLAFLPGKGEQDYGYEE